MHPFSESEKLFFPFAVNLVSFISAFLIAFIPCSFISLIQNRGSFKRLLFKIPVYAFYLSLAAMAATFIISLPLYINMNLCKIDELIGMLCIFSAGVVPFVSILLVTWAIIMLLMLLRDRILRWRRN